MRGREPIKSIFGFFSRHKSLSGFLLPALIFLSLFVAGRIIDLHHDILLLRSWILSLGVWGGFVYVLVYTVTQLFLMPGFPLIILAVLLFGGVWGYVVMTAATTLSAAVSFLVARYAAKVRVEKMLGAAPGFQRLKEMLDRNAWFVIPFVRLVPILPDSLNNYALGLTRIPFWKCMLLSILTFLPLNALYVSGTGVLYDILVRGRISWKELAIMIGVAAVLLAAGHYLTKWSTRRKFGPPPGSKR